MENKKAISALIVNALRLLNEAEQAALCRALIERSEKVQSEIIVFIEQRQEQYFYQKTAEAIDAGGGCSRCSDLSGFECICDDEDDDWDYCCEICLEFGSCRNADDVRAYHELYGDH